MLVPDFANSIQLNIQVTQSRLALFTHNLPLTTSVSSSMSKPPFVMPKLCKTHCRYTCKCSILCPLFFNVLFGRKPPCIWQGVARLCWCVCQPRCVTSQATQSERGCPHFTKSVSSSQPTSMGRSLVLCTSLADSVEHFSVVFLLISKHFLNCGQLAHNTISTNGSQFVC